MKISDKSLPNFGNFGLHSAALTAGLGTHEYGMGNKVDSPEIPMIHVCLTLGIFRFAVCFFGGLL